MKVRPARSILQSWTCNAAGAVEAPSAEVINSARTLEKLFLVQGLQWIDVRARKRTSSLGDFFGAFRQYDQVRNPIAHLARESDAAKAGAGHDDGCIDGFVDTQLNCALLAGRKFDSVTGGLQQTRDPSAKRSVLRYYQYALSHPESVSPRTFGVRQYIWLLHLNYKSDNGLVVRVS